MSKWTVCRKNTMFIHPDEDDFCYGPRWCIISPIGVKWEDKATFSEAIACADEQARTREYVLPRVNNPAGEFEIIQSSSTVEIYSPAGDATAYTTYEQAKPLALALLAHAERKKHDQHRKSR